MRLSIAAALVGLASAAPPPGKGYYPYPLKDGFPNPSPEGLADIQRRAGGQLPNGPPSAPPDTPGMVADLQVIAFNEIFETTYFNQLLENVTESKPGYEIPLSLGKDYVVKLLTQLVAQEEMHSLLGNSGLKALGVKTIEPVRYLFPVSDILGALNFAAIFTTVVLGGAQSVITDLVDLGRAEMAQNIASVIGNEGEQAGLFRAINGKVASSSPTMSVGTGQFQYNFLLQNGVVPGSNKNKIDIPAYDHLTVTNTIHAKDMTLQYKVVSKTAPTEANHITYLSGQNVPLSEKISNIKAAGAGAYTFEAAFPFQAGNFSKGLSVAALTKGTGYVNASTVTADTTAGPGIIWLE